MAASFCKPKPIPTPTAPPSTDSAGAPLAGGQLWTYAAGTSTPLATYSDSAGTVPNTNPVTLDARGEAVIYWGPAPYKVILKDADGATIWTVDNVASGLADLASTATGKGTAPVGSGNGNSKLSELLAARVRADKRPQYVIAAELGVHQSLISKIKRGHIWKPV